MKIASSSASFASELAEGTLTQLEWLDLCAAELELDGVVLDARHFPRGDADYLAQLKKTATDLGLTIVALAPKDALEPSDTRNRLIPGQGVSPEEIAAEPDKCYEKHFEMHPLDQAIELGAPLVLVDAPRHNDDPTVWDRFIAVLKPLATRAKNRNVTLALRNAPQTLCATVAACKRAAKDIDSAWLRFALDATTLGALETTAELISKTVIATHTIGDVATFATAGDAEASRLLARLRGFRGFLSLDRGDRLAEDPGAGTGPSGASTGPRDAFHRAILRLRTLAARQVIDDSTAG